MNDLSRPDLESFRAALEAHLGLSFNDDKISLLREVLASRLSAVGIESVERYLEYLASYRSERAEIARHVSVAETYFLRNQAHFRALEEILSRRTAAGKAPPRMLSAGCSSGEEAYSLAILSLPYLEKAAGPPPSIMAFDINPDALKKARDGRYSPWSLRSTPEAIRQRFLQRDGKAYLIDEKVRRMVRFEQRNLLDPDSAFWRPNAFDVVFFRNVLMYLTPEASRRVVAKIARSLAEGGYLFLGHAENLRGISRDFHLLHSHETFFYQRRSRLSAGEEAESRAPPPRAPAAPSPPPLPDDVSWFEAIARSSSRIEALATPPPAGSGAARRAKRAQGASAPPAPRLPARESPDNEAAMALMQQEKFHDALAVLAATPAALDEDPDALLLKAMALVSSGDFESAERTCGQLLQIDELNAGAHHVMALCREYARDTEGAIDHNQIAAYLDPDFAMPHLHLGLIGRRAADTEMAQRELKVALHLLPREDAARLVLFGGGFKRDALLELCRSELRRCEDR